MTRRLQALILTILLLLTSGIVPALAEVSEFSVECFDDPVRPGKSSMITYYLPEATEISLTVETPDGELLAVIADGIPSTAGENAIWWNGTFSGVVPDEGPAVLCLSYGEFTTTFDINVGTPYDPLSEETLPEVLLDEEDGEKAEGTILTIESEVIPDSTPSHAITEENDQRQYTPTYGSPYAGQDTTVNYWTLPMDITDEAAVWAMLTAPITVVDNGKANNQRNQTVIYREPDASSEAIGTVTYTSQGVHVLETRDEWTLIECYSSSFHDSKVKAWNMLVQGWVPTKYIRTVTPNQELGYVIDKLTQRLYIFKDGHLYDTLLVSTGKANKKQPYNETRAGEFLMMVPEVGGFSDGSMICSMAIRFNGGDLIHEVPHTTGQHGNYYGTYEPSLGKKASHGCVRVQRHRTSLGTNMSWIWENRKNNTKLVIWEDWQGRQIPYPDDDLPVYYNPKGGTMYHSSETCYSAKGKTFTAITYGELETDAFRKLTTCTWCNPPLRHKDIDEINLTYAPGGDHEPVLTEARKKQGYN